MAFQPWGSMGMLSGAPPERLTDEFYHIPRALSTLFSSFYHEIRGKSMEKAWKYQRFRPEGALRCSWPFLKKIKRIRLPKAAVCGML